MLNEFIKRELMSLSNGTFVSNISLTIDLLMNTHSFCGFHHRIYLSMHKESTFSNLIVNGHKNFDSIRERHNNYMSLDFRTRVTGPRFYQVLLNSSDIHASFFFFSFSFSETVTE